MKRICVVAAMIILGLPAVGFAHHKSKPEFEVKVVDEKPLLNNYDWSASGTSYLDCDESGCYGNYTPPTGGTNQVTGAIVELQLPDGRIVIAECDMKPDNYQNFMNALNADGPTVSTIYRDCRVPQVDATIRAKFNGNDVKLYMQEPSIDGKGKKYSETYWIRRTIDPASKTMSALPTQ